MSEHLSHNNVFLEFQSPEDMEPADQELLIAARNAMKLAYSPYSHFLVGAAVRVEDGSIIPGANQENASYGLVICAERSTLFTANNLGYGDKVKAIAIMAKGEDFETDKPVAPCGACRQVLKEFLDRAGQPIKIIFSGSTGPIHKYESIDELLPASFGPRDLNIQI